MVRSSFVNFCPPCLAKAPYGPALVLQMCNCFYLNELSLLRNYVLLVKIHAFFGSILSFYGQNIIYSFELWSLDLSGESIAWKKIYWNKVVASRIINSGWHYSNPTPPFFQKVLSIKR